MGLFDTILGRTKPIKANLDALFALPSAAVTLQVSCGVVSTGKAGVCFKPPAGQPFAEMQSELEKLLNLDETGAKTASGAPLTVRHVGDSFGYRWILVEGGQIDDLVTRVHMVHSSLEDAGWSTQLLCSVFGFAPAPPDAPDSSSAGAASPAAADDSTVTSIASITQPIYLVYLAKQGTFYPFAPTGKEQRDSELELRIKSVLAEDLPFENDLTRWFPIWDLPVASA